MYEIDKNKMHTKYPGFTVLVDLQKENVVAFLKLAWLLWYCKMSAVVLATKACGCFSFKFFLMSAAVCV